MNNSYLLDHLRPTTLARLIAELLNDHADEYSTGEFTFHAEAAKAAYVELLDAGYRLLPEEEFWPMIETALAHVD